MRLRGSQSGWVDSKSDVQSEVEEFLIKAFGRKHRLKFSKESRRIELKDGNHVRVDAATKTRSVLVEAFAHLGKHRPVRSL